MVYEGKSIMLMYVDGLIILHQDKNRFDHMIKMMKNVFKMKDMGNLDNYLVVNIQRQENKVILTQPQLIEQIIKNVKLPAGTKPVFAPEMATKILTKIPEEPHHNPALFNY